MMQLTASHIFVLKLISDIPRDQTRSMIKRIFSPAVMSPS